MPNQTSFIILEGLLGENGDYELLAGYETDTALAEHRKNTNDIGLEVVLLDASGAVLGSAVPDVRFPVGCTDQPTHVGRGVVLAAISRHDQAAEIAVRIKDREVFACEVGKAPPAVAEFHVKPTSKKRLSIKMGFGQEKPDLVQLFLKTRDGMRFPVPSIENSGKTSLDLSQYAGFGEATLIVVASKACRSTRVESEPFALPAAKPAGKILQPLHGAVCGSGERMSLVANLSDQNGRKLAWDAESMCWEIDGKPIADVRQIALCPELGPGKHRIALLRVKKNGKMERLDEVEIEVEKPTAGLKAYHAALARFREHQKADTEKCLGAGARSPGAGV